MFKETMGMKEQPFNPLHVGEEITVPLLESGVVNVEILQKRKKGS